MTTAAMQHERSDYGVDAPAVMQNLFLFGVLCLLIALFAPAMIHFGPVSLASRSFLWPDGFFIGEGLLFLLYIKVGKFRHRDFMLGLHVLSGKEHVLDVGCGCGLLLVGAAKRLSGTGHATSVDIWSTVDMGGNAEAATQQNLRLEGIGDRCTLVSESAAEMSFPDASFDVIVSTFASTICTTGPPGSAPCDTSARLQVETKRGSFISTFPPLTVVVAHKPHA